MVQRSTLTVPATSGGSLATEVKNNLSRGRQPDGTQTRVIEDGGVCARVGTSFQEMSVKGRIAYYVSRRVEMKGIPGANRAT